MEQEIKARDAIVYLRHDLRMLESGQWEPDGDSIDAMLEMLKVLETALDRHELVLQETMTYVNEQMGQ